MKIILTILVFFAITGIPLFSVLMTRLVAEFNVDAAMFCGCQAIFIIVSLIISAHYYTYLNSND